MPDVTASAPVPAPSSASLEQDFDLLRGSCGLVELPELSHIVLTGEDRKGWLQGQATNDLRELDNGASFAFCFCTPTGHFVSPCHIWGLADHFVLAVPTSALAAVLERCEAMVVMEDVTATTISDEIVCLSIQGPEATRQVSELVPLPLLDSGVGEIEGAEVRLLRSNWAGMGGWDILVPRAAQSAIDRIKASFPSVSFAAYDAARLEAGQPRFGLDMTEKTLVPEMGPKFIAKNVSYKKGCYVGQEVIMRMYSRGHANWQWVGLLSEEPLEPGATVSHRSRSEAGRVTSSAFSPDFGHIAAAILRHEISLDNETVTVQTENGPVEAQVQIMPILRME